MKILRRLNLALIAVLVLLNSCKIDDFNGGGGNQEITFSKIGSFTNGTGDEGFAEISAFDPATAKLFVVNPNNSELSVWDISDPTSPIQGAAIALEGIPNSVAVYKGMVAVAIENASNKQANGVIATYDADSQAVLQIYPAGPLPDMVTFSPNGKYIIAANEGEPNDAYTIDPEGSITIIDIASGQIDTVDFTSYNNREIPNDFRVFGPGATFAQDVEPEYIAVSADSKKAYVVLQENNGIAIINLRTKAIDAIIGLGVKDYALPENQIDASDKDDVIGNFQNWPVLGFYHPDAIAITKIRGAEFLITANEGDARDYDGYSEETRVKDLVLDPVKYPNAEELQQDQNLGRLKTTTANGDLDNDGDIDQIYAYGGRSFTIWSTGGHKIYDSGSQIAKKVLELDPAAFNSNEGDGTDERSDDKGVEPESVATLKLRGQTLLFVGLERTGGVMVYDMSNPSQPEYIDWLRDASDISPEGLIVVKPENSPTGNALVIVTHEVSNTVAIYEVK